MNSKIFVILLEVWIASLFFPLNPTLAGEDEFPRGKGRSLVVETCTTCHSSKLVLQNGMTRENWDVTITWMQEKQGLRELTKKDRKTILDYLSMVLNVRAENSNPAAPVMKEAPRKFRVYQYDYKPNRL